MGICCSYDQHFNLNHSMDKFSKQQTNDIFSYFSQKTGFDISCKLSPNGDNLHEISNPVFWGKKEKKYIINLSTVELARRVVKVKI